VSSDIVTVHHYNGKVGGVFFTMFLGMTAIMEVSSHRKPASARNLEAVFILQINLPCFIQQPGSPDLQLLVRPHAF
jgi:hypothetical protein